MEVEIKSHIYKYVCFQHLTHEYVNTYSSYGNIYLKPHSHVSSYSRCANFTFTQILCRGIFWCMWMGDKQDLNVSIFSPVAKFASSQSRCKLRFSHLSPITCTCLHMGCIFFEYMQNCTISIHVLYHVNAFLCTMPDHHTICKMAAVKTKQIDMSDGGFSSHKISVLIGISPNTEQKGFKQNSERTSVEYKERSGWRGSVWERGGDHVLARLVKTDWRQTLSDLTVLNESVPQQVSSRTVWQWLKEKNTRDAWLLRKWLLHKTIGGASQK